MHFPEDEGKEQAGKRNAGTIRQELGISGTLEIIYFNLSFEAKAPQ